MAARKTVRKKAARKRSGRAGRGSAKVAWRPGPTLRFVATATTIVAFVAGITVATWVAGLDRIVVSRFEGQRFAVPSRVFSAPTYVYPGITRERLDLEGWLARLGYREQPGSEPLAVGAWRAGRDRVLVHLRGFSHPNTPEPARRVEFRFTPAGRGKRSASVLAELRDPYGEVLPVVTLEPEPISAFYGEEREQRELVELDEVPRHLIDAVTAVEDRRFLEHHGIDPRRIAGALIANLKAGRITQGGSTLTQQLVKNFFLTPERTFDRKLREAVMALIVELRYDKPAILEAYLNEIYLGQRGSTAIHGMGEAARLYFGKSVEDLDVAESALLAAIIQSPNGHSPYRQPERAKERRDLVLRLMHEQAMLPEREMKRAIDQPIRLARIVPEDTQARYFLDALRKQLPEVYGEDVLESEGLGIHSTLAPDMQRAAVRHLVHGLERIEANLPAPAEGEIRSPLQGCLLAMRPTTGEILALVGGRDYGESQFNRCTQARRQVGSVFKPLAYIAGLEPSSGPAITLASLLEDEPFELELPGDDEPWRPENYDHRFRGPVRAREALERSLNVPTVRLGQQVGIDRVVSLARRLGVRGRLPAVPSLVLGTAEVSPLEVARVYATLANRGLKPVPRTFLGIVDADGVVQTERALDPPKRELDTATAFLATSMLQGVVDRGTAAGVRSRGLTGPIAGKTGTTDDEFDLWFVGYTPELVAVVWVGFDEPRAVGVPSSRGALPIWADFVEDVVGRQVRGAFTKPQGIVEVDIDPTTGRRALFGCPHRQTEYFLEGTEPTETCPERGVFERRSDDDGEPGFLQRALRRLFGS